MRSLDWFPFYTSNRRSGKPVIERVIGFDEKDLRYLGEKGDAFYRDLLAELRATGILDERDDGGFPYEPLPDVPMQRFASMFAQLAVLFQRKSGHPVTFYSVMPEPARNRCTCLVEHEHCDVGMTAVQLAWQVMLHRCRDLSSAFGTLAEFARPRILPADTRAIVDAATRRGIPCRNLDRNPYGRDPEAPLADLPWTRANALLRLGHAGYQVEIEGTFCAARSPVSASLLNKGDDGARQLLTQLGIPAAPAGAVAGEGVVHVIVADGAVIGALRPVADSRGFEEITGPVHPSALEHATKAFRALDAGIIVLGLQVPDPGGSLETGGGRAVSLDPAPALDRYLPAGSPVLDQAAERLLDWLFPPGAPSRIPIVAVTGTNGKTTTCRMIGHVMKAAGHHPGLVCSDAIYVDQELVRAGHHQGLPSHLEILGRDDVDIAVLETSSKTIYKTGFAWDWCNVAVCTNVSEDHLHSGYLKTMDEMAEVKRALLEHARDAVVVNADDARCLGMVPHAAAPVACLVSTRASAAELDRLAGGECNKCVLEEVDGRATIVLYDGARRVPVMGAGGIPATHGGVAKFIVENAMYAVAACYCVGVDVQTVARALSSFETNWESTPGRLNFYDGHPFTVLLDYAHNPDGMRRLCETVDGLDVGGRKLLMFQAAGIYDDDFVRHVAAEAAGHFDHYVCRSHPVYTGSDPQKILDITVSVLRESGVGEDRITATHDPDFAVDTLLRMGREGDLLVFTPGAGQRDRTWEKIVTFSPQAA